MIAADPFSVIEFLNAASVIFNGFREFNLIIKKSRNFVAVGNAFCNEIL